jgi:uncharacterized protein with NAD-binding domain and iron-sulfur cluster
MSASGRPAVAILGGGMAALTAAWELSEGDWTARFRRITVYQRGWRLGGKGASSRGPHGRIEEHGLHVLLGYYDHTFDVMRRCYEELDRTRSDPACPIRTWDDAIAPSNHVGVADRDGDGWVPWVATFRPTPGRPGDDSSEPGTVAELVTRSIRLLIDFLESLGPPADRTGSVQLSASSRPRPARAPDAAAIWRGAALLGVAVPLSVAHRMAGALRSDRSSLELERFLSSIIQPLREVLAGAVRSDPAARRTHQLVELVIANLAGIVADGLLTRSEGFAAVDHLDYRAWLLGHGIEPEALDSPLLRGMYDLVFGYEGGDPGRPRFAAGLGLQLATRMLLGYSGGLFWKMQAGMGEVLFAPLYQVLRARGVEFRFFHRVDALRLTEDRRAVRSIEMGVQAEVERGPDAYDPLLRIKDLPCWPAGPLGAQLRHPESARGVDLESYWSNPRDAGRCTLVAGEDFDAVVFGISVGMVPYVCGDLVAHSARWRAMVEHLGTVATQSLQLWLGVDERSLGWRGPEGVAVSGFAEPFDTWASMSHLGAREDWPDGCQPKSIAYFCGVLGGASGSGGPVDERAATAAVRAGARVFLDRDVAALWPGAAGQSGFRWDLLCDAAGGGTGPATGPERLDGQYWRANVDPSDRYVQSLPGSDRYRLQPGATGFDNLVVAGDWTDCGLNAGCVEAATRSGQLAARAVMERAAVPVSGGADG